MVENVDRSRSSLQKGDAFVGTRFLVAANDEETYVG